MRHFTLPLRRKGSGWLGKRLYDLEFPVFIDRLDCPIELLAQRLGKEPLNRDIEFLREYNGETRINIVLATAWSAGTLQQYTTTLGDG